MTSTPTLSGKTAVVTGASRGIGRTTALKLAQAGARVYAGAPGVKELKELHELEKRSAHISGLELDVASPESVKRFADTVLDAHEVDILVNNAGVWVFKKVEETTLEEWDRIYNVNVRGTFLVTKAFLPSLRSQKGHIVNVTSDVSARTFAGGSLYTSSKHAQRAFTRALQMEVADDGVRVTEVRPGVVATYFYGSQPRPADENALSDEDVADAILYALLRPARMRLDEIHFHPMGQTVEF